MHHPTTVLDVRHDPIVLAEVDRHRRSTVRTSSVLDRSAAVLASIDEVLGV